MSLALPKRDSKVALAFSGTRNNPRQGQDNMKNLKVTSLIPLLLVLGCGGGSDGGGTGSGSGAGSGVGQLAVKVTDKPIDFEMVESAVLMVSSVKAHAAGDDDGSFTTLYHGAAIEFDLKLLTNGETTTIALAEVPGGSYDQIRFVLSDGRLELVNGNVYSTELGNLELTSTDTAGWKVFFDPPIVVHSDSSETVLLDFDMSKTFKPVPASDPMDADKFLVHPVVKGSTLSATGGIEGLVLASDGAGGFAGVDAATVHVLPPGVTDPALAVTSTGTDVNGNYAVLGLAPGTYDLHASKNTLEGSALGQVVSAGMVTTVDITIQPTTGTIAGSVTESDGLGGFLPVAGATVLVLPPGVTDPLQAVASATSAADGTYSAAGLEPGTYDVQGTMGLLTATVASQVVTAGATTIVDIVLQAPAPTTGDISGSVQQSDGLGGFLPVAGATVLVLPPGVTDPLLAVATATSAADGTYAATGLAPGTYDVQATMGLLTGTVAGQVVSAGATTTVDVVIQ